MEEGHASRTALLVAAYRARASARPARLIDDPWAAGLAGADGEAIAERVDTFMKDRELWIAVRTAHFDAELSRWIARRTPTQVVVLGAGFDTRAARFATPGARFFEVDHPATQAEKRRRLEGLDGYPLEAASFVSCDFEREDFLDRMVANGFDRGAPAFILWEGVTPYLHEPAVRSTLRRIASGCHPESQLWFDHFTRKFVEAAALPEADLKARELVDALGERFVFGTNDPLPMLFEEGFRHVRSVSFDEACLSLTGTYERERQFRFQRMVLASVTAPR